MTDTLQTLWDWVCTAAGWLLMVPVGLVFILGALANQRDRNRKQ